MGIQQALLSSAFESLLPSLTLHPAPNYPPTLLFRPVLSPLQFWASLSVPQREELLRVPLAPLLQSV